MAGLRNTSCNAATKLIKHSPLKPTFTCSLVVYFNINSSQPMISPVNIYYAVWRAVGLISASLIQSWVKKEENIMA